jgi:hypothetical protein
MSSEEKDLTRKKAKSITKSVATKANVHKSKSRTSRVTTPAHILVKIDDELNFLIEKIADQKSDRIFLSAEDNALLLSSKVSVKLLQEKLDQMAKTMIVVTSDPISAKTCLDVGVMTVPKPEGIESDVWEELEDSSTERLRKSLLRPEPVDQAQLAANLEKVKENVQYEKEIPQEEPSKVPEPIVGKAVDLDGFSMVVGGDILEHKKNVNIEDTEIDSGKNPDLTQDTNEMADDSRITPGRNLLGSNFSRPSYASKRAADNPMPTSAEKPIEITDKEPHKFSLDKEKLAAIKAKILKPQVLVPAGLVLIGLLVLAYLFLPRVIVNIEVESVAAEASFEATADKSVTKVNIKEVIIPAKEETEEASGSDTAPATGKGNRGEKATGDISIVNTGINPVDVAKGTTVTRSGGKQYVTVTAVVVPGIGGGSASVGIQAVAVGEDYNYSGASGSTTFSIQGHPSLTGTNSGNIAGGSSEEYTAVTQKDIDTVTDALKKKLFEEGVEKIKELHTNDDWKLIEQSIKSEVVDEPQLDAKAGDEKDNINVSIQSKTTALFYDEKSLNKVVESKLEEDVAEAEGGSDTKDFKMAEDVEITITIKSNENGVAKLEVTADGLLTPQIDKDDVVNVVKGQNIVKGTAALEDMEFVSKEPKITFLPRWFPGFLHRFPSDANRIEVMIKYVSGETSED